MFHSTWSGSLINFIGPNCTSVDVVWKQETYMDQESIVFASNLLKSQTF